MVMFILENAELEVIDIGNINEVIVSKKTIGSNGPS